MIERLRRERLEALGQLAAAGAALHEAHGRRADGHEFLTLHEAERLAALRLALQQFDRACQALREAESRAA